MDVCRGGSYSPHGRQRAGSKTGTVVYFLQLSAAYWSVQDLPKLAISQVFPTQTCANHFIVKLQCSHLVFKGSWPPSRVLRVLKLQHCSIIQIQSPLRVKVLAVSPLKPCTHKAMHTHMCSCSYIHVLRGWSQIISATLSVGGHHSEGFQDHQVLNTLS